MAAFFDKMKESLNKGSTIVSAKSQTLIETNRVKSEIANLEKEKNASINEIGRRMYEMKKSGEIIMEQIDPIFENIFKVEQRIIEKEQEKNEILRKEEEKLSSLNQSVETNAPEVVPFVEPTTSEPIDVEEVVDVRVCSCGASLPSGAKFCISCGSKVEEV